MEVGRAYATLGIGPEVSEATLRSAYRSALRRHHPDTSHGGDPRALATVRDAYRTLSARRAHDAALRRTVLRPTERGPVRHVDVYA